MSRLESNRITVTSDFPINHLPECKVGHGGASMESQHSGIERGGLQILAQLGLDSIKKASSLVAYNPNPAIPALKTPVVGLP